MFVVVLTCIGLFGLSSVITTQRIREIGIRKVLGGRAIDIIYILLKDIVILLVFSLVIAAPLAGWGINIWLRDFTYKQAVGPSTYVIAWLVALLTAVATALYHTFKAVNLNPTIALRHE